MLTTVGKKNAPREARIRDESTAVVEEEDSVRPIPVEILYEFVEHVAPVLVERSCDQPVRAVVERVVRDALHIEDGAVGLKLKNLAYDSVKIFQ